MKGQISYTEARNDLSNIMNSVCTNHEPVLIERRNGGNAVLISEEDWKSIQETLYLMSSRKDWNAIIDPIDVSECSDSLPW
ncbi:MAG: type II toxin-antitoxin system Phd/YefM family antitoxin [Holosporaceae bacterium]|jgi:antitoxin YefM|nr:type II toxin-antitoxin system Phd/YefM family antitoxin [Holosporaceae bacterium]